MECRGLGRDCSCSYTPSDLHCLLKRSSGQPRAFRHHQQYKHFRYSHQRQRQWLHAADLSADFPRGDEEPPELSEVFPRIRESNPHRYMTCFKRLLSAGRLLDSLSCFAPTLPLKAWHYIFKSQEWSQTVTIWMKALPESYCGF